jgi:hypothetical protein
MHRGIRFVRENRFWDDSKQKKSEFIEKEINN